MGHFRLSFQRGGAQRDVTLGIRMKRAAKPEEVQEACPECPEPEPCATGCVPWNDGWLAYLGEEQLANSGSIFEPFAIPGFPGDDQSVLLALMNPDCYTPCQVPIMWDVTINNGVESPPGDASTIIITDNFNGTWTVDMLGLADDYDGFGIFPQVILTPYLDPAYLKFPEGCDPHFSGGRIPFGTTWNGLEVAFSFTYS